MTAIQWSPDNSQLAIGYSSGVIEIQDRSTGTSSYLGEYGSNAILALGWHPIDADLLAVGRGAGVFQLLNVDTGQLLQYTFVEADEVRSLDWNHDGTMLATGYYYTSLLHFTPTPFLINIWTPDGIQLVHSLEAHTKAVTSVSWSNLPGDNRLVSGGDDRRVVLWDGDSGTELAQLFMDSPVSQVVWAPDEAKVAVLAGEQITFWEVSSSALIPITNATYVGNDLIDSLAWRSDGLAVAFVEGADVRIYQLWTEIPYVSNNLGRSYNSVAWSNSDDIAFGTTQETLVVVDAPYEDDPDLKPTPTGSYEPPTETPTPLGTPPPTLTSFPVPIPDAGPDRTIETYRDTANVAFDSSGTVDPAGVIESYTWYVDDVFVAVGETATILMTIGVHDVDLVVIFEYDNGVQTFVSDTVIITIVKVPTDN